MRNRRARVARPGNARPDSEPLPKEGATVGQRRQYSAASEAAVQLGPGGRPERERTVQQPGEPPGAAGDADRPRERLARHGAGALSSAELIGVVWGSGTHGMSATEAAADALRRHDGLLGLARATDVELDAVPGIGPARAAQLAAAFELGRRVVADWPAARWIVHSPRDVGERLVPQMGILEREELRVVLLNTRNVVLRAVTVYQGNVSSSLVRIGELFRDAVRINAAGLIIAHNHPSGDPTPSPDDLRLTAEALAAGRLLDVEVLDHLIVASDTFVSLRDRGIAFDRPP